MARGEKMRESYKKLLSQVNFLENNIAWSWQIQRLQSEISTLKNVLIEAGILVDTYGKIKETVVVLDGQPYSIIREKK